MSSSSGLNPTPHDFSHEECKDELIRGQMTGVAVGAGAVFVLHQVLKSYVPSYRHFPTTFRGVGGGILIAASWFAGGWIASNECRARIASYQHGGAHTQRRADPAIGRAIINERIGAQKQHSTPQPPTQAPNRN